MTSEEKIHEGNWASKIFHVGKWYMVANFLTKGIGILMLPVLTHNLSSNEYGLLNTILSISLFFPFLVSLALESSFSRFFHDEKASQKKLSKLFSTLFWFVLVFGSFMIFTLLLSAKLWVGFILDIDPYPLIYIAIVPILFTQLSALGLAFLQQTLKSGKIGIIQFVAAIFKVSTILPLLLWCSFGVKAVLWGNAVGSVISFLIIIWIVWRTQLIKFHFDKSMLYRSLGYSLPLIPGLAFTWTNSMVDRVVIAKFDSLEGVGIYTFAFQIGLILYFIGDAATKVIMPMGLSGFTENFEETSEKMVSTSLNLLALLSFVSLSGMFFSREAVFLLGNVEYINAIYLIPIVLLPAIWGMQYRFFILVISYFKKTWMISLTAFIAAAINLTLNLIFVPKYGYVVGAYTTLCSSLAYFFITFYLSQSLYKVNYEYLRTGAIFLVNIIAFFVCTKMILAFELSLMNLLIKCVVLTMIGLLLFQIGRIPIFKYFISTR